jgi:competence protein ComGC
MDRRIIILIAILSSSILLIQITDVYAGDSEARKKAKERERQIVADKDNEYKLKLEKEKKDLEPKTENVDIIKTKNIAAKEAAEKKRTERQKAIQDGKAAIENAKIKFDQARKDLRLDSKNPDKIKAVTDAEIAFKKAKNDLALLRIS